MLFNSIEFAIFLPIVFVIYWLITKCDVKLQNSFLVLASYFFYGWWDWRFLVLIAFSSLVDYLVGIQLVKYQNRTVRRLFLMISILVNLGFLGFFKYYNFFSENFAEAFTILGEKIEPSRLNIILPVGISFYTFQTMSYSIDVYRRKLEPTNDIIAFFAFVSFFPQLVAGPIERATNLLPQFYKQRVFGYENGLKGISQIIWGLFKKVVVADSCACIVNQIFDDYSSLSGSTLLLGVFLFAFQIYGDFSGYSDIAIGTARLFGFNLKVNFSYPYFSRDIAEFWRKWHISLSSWFRDYLYFPLGGSRGNKLNQIRNVFIIFVVSGFWHGANWTFLVWGIYNACLFIPLLLFNKNRKHIEPINGNFFPSMSTFLKICTTFILITIGWVFFRSENLDMAFDYISIIFSSTLFSFPYVFGVGLFKAALTIVFIVLMLMVEWIGRTKEIPIYLNHKRRIYQWVLCYLLVIVIFLFGEKQQDFIYFQF
jgi:D-alanyl-lipoteichoic acid acyltransferase DltB (MBOAT superfamily)